ncbi:hypothetical protein J8J17_26755, partial [Mycobacterium tuberculosis]|nr:hypothetical protein [Mycobacterium tuberculosis]
YSLRKSWIDNVSQYASKNAAGRVTYEARAKGLRNFFDIVRGFGKERAPHYDADFVTQHAFNHKPRNGDAACTAAQDCK